MSRGQSGKPAPEMPFLFGTGFFHDHVGQIIDDPAVAIVELVANSYDAGADKVTVMWPDLPGKVLSITDNGTGMTRQEFEKRWKTLAYDRVAEQGFEVAFPSGARKSKRTAFGHNGKGRFSPLCFSDEYEVETWKDGTCTTAKITLASGGPVPFVLTIQKEKPKSGHGTCVSTVARRNLPTADFISELIGFRFAVDPSFVITVNGKTVKLLSLSRLSTQQLEIGGHGTITVHRLDPLKQERTMRLKGIAWWVNRRMVGEPSWDGLDGPGQYLDGRTVEARRFSFVVEADILGGETKPDWTGFKETPRVAAVRKSVHALITDQLRGLMASDRKSLKKSAIQQHRYLIQQLPPISQRQIGRFIDEVQERCPHVTQKDLSRTIEILGKLEQGRSGYDLLKQLAACSPEDLDAWNSLMQQWTATNAEIVLNELARRLTVVKELQELIRDKHADELRELQPLFERGLWMFGPEFESVEFTSNRSMTTVVRQFFERVGVDASRSRPDFVVLPDSSVGLYCADEFTNGEVSGTRKILIVELKRGGFCLTQKELDQARDYAKELRKTGCAQPTTEIEAYVLGASLEPTLQEMKIGDRTLVRPCPYDLILNRAHARTFNLHKRIQETKPQLNQDEEMRDALADSSLDFES
jgi:histidine kinase/DNA gyrase B/HSP90-like ATPase